MSAEGPAPSDPRRAALGVHVATELVRLLAPDGRVRSVWVYNEIQDVVAVGGNEPIIGLRRRPGSTRNDLVQEFTVILARMVRDRHIEIDEPRRALLRELGVTKYRRVDGAFDWVWS